jgi:hypothetical protein
MTLHSLLDKLVSPWHEIPLHAGDGLLHYICEIPKETSAKMEVATVSKLGLISGVCTDLKLQSLSSVLTITMCDEFDHIKGFVSVSISAIT